MPSPIHGRMTRKPPCASNSFQVSGVKCLPTSLGDSPKHPRWSPDGKRLYYDPRPADSNQSRSFWDRDVQFGRRQTVPYHPIRLAPPGYRTPYDVNKDGQLVGLIPMGQDEFRLIPAKAIVVVRNWFETPQTETQVDPPPFFLPARFCAPIPLSKQEAIRLSADERGWHVTRYRFQLAVLRRRPATFG